MSAMEQIRERYGVPAARGVRVTVEGRKGVIVGTQRGCLRLLVRFDGERHTSICHPTWEIKYHERAGGTGDTE